MNGRDKTNLPSITVELTLSGTELTTPKINWNCSKKRGLLRKSLKDKTDR